MNLAPRCLKLMSYVASLFAKQERAQVCVCVCVCWGGAERVCVLSVCLSGVSTYLFTASRCAQHDACIRAPDWHFAGGWRGGGGCEASFHRVDIMVTLLENISSGKTSLQKTKSSACLGSISCTAT